MPEEPLSGRDLRVAALALVATLALVLAATWYVVLRPPGPSVPRDRGHLSLSPATAHAGDELEVHVDQPIDRPRTETMLVDRWDGHRWTDTRVLSDGEWSRSTTATYAAVTTGGTGDLTSWSFGLPLGVPAGHYLVCDTRSDCAVLEVV